VLIGTGELMRSPGIERINELGQAVVPWLAAATCFALLAGSVQERWLLLIFASMCSFCAGSALILVVRSCWREVLGWLLDRFKKST
jgi:hypothetical protein